MKPSLSSSPPLQLSLLRRLLLRLLRHDRSPQRCLPLSSGPRQRSRRIRHRLLTPPLPPLLQQTGRRLRCRFLRPGLRMSYALLAVALVDFETVIYTNSGVAILAFASNAIHLLWKWPRNERNSRGKATASVVPQLWQPPSGIWMTNEITDTNPEVVVHCFALSKNDSYVMSASGGEISLFNMMAFKTMKTFMPAPPAATFLALHAQDNNIIAIGMDDSTIQIYNVRVDELCTWGTDGWEKQKSIFLQIPSGHTPSTISDTHVQFCKNQLCFLAVHETQIAIYETSKLECVKQWAPREGSAPMFKIHCIL